MVTKIVFVLITFVVLCSADDSPSCSEGGACPDQEKVDVAFSIAKLREVAEKMCPTLMATLLPALVGVALLIGYKLQFRAWLPWWHNQYPSKVFILNPKGEELVGSLRDVEQLRRRLNEIEKERDELKTLVENKLVTEKPSEVNLVPTDSERWENTVNSLQRKSQFVCASRSEYVVVSPAMCSVNSESSSVFQSKRNFPSSMKMPSLPSRKRAGSHIPMPSKPSQVFTSADYARKCREMLCKLSASEKLVSQLQDELESTKKIREEFEIVVEQRNLLNRKVVTLTREKKEMGKQVITLQMDIKAVRGQFDDVRKQHAALTRQFDQLNTNTKAMAKDKRLLNRQLCEAREELELAMAKLDGIHEEKAQLVETIEQLVATQNGSVRSIETQAVKSTTDIQHKQSSSQRMPFRNRFSTAKQKNSTCAQFQAPSSSFTFNKKTSSKPKTVTIVQPNEDKVMTPKSSVEVIHKLAKTLEDKCQEFVKQKSFAKDRRELVKTSRLDKITNPKPDKESYGELSSKNKNTQGKENCEKREDKTQPVDNTLMKVVTKSGRSKKETKPKELGAKSSVDITEFARSLQRLERNVEINMRVRESAGIVNHQREDAAVQELFLSEEPIWEESPCPTISDTDLSGVSVSDLEMVLGRASPGRNSRSLPDDRCSTCSVCCVDSQCSVGSTIDCPLEHRSCSDLNCLATCSSCSLPLELSQSIESYEDRLEVVEGENRRGLASIFGQGLVGKGAPWNLPGLSGIMTRTSRPTGSVQASQGSLNEVGDVVFSNTMTSYDADVELPHAEGAKKKLSCFTANEDNLCAKRTVSGSPAFKQFIHELSTLVQGKEAPAAAVTGTRPNQDSQPMPETLVNEFAGNESRETFNDSEEESVDMCFSQTTQYFVNNEKEPIF